MDTQRVGMQRDKTNMFLYIMKNNNLFSIC